MNIELEEGEIPDTTIHSNRCTISEAELEAWPKRWKTVPSKSGRMYFFDTESGLKIWVDDVGKLENWQKFAKSGESNLFYYSNSSIKISVWEKDFLIMKIFHDSMSTPLSEPRPLFSPDVEEMQVNEPTVDQQERRLRKAAKLLREELISAKSIKICKEKMRTFIKIWADKAETPSDFCSFFAAKLAHELVHSRGPKGRMLHQNALKLIVGKRLTRKLADHRANPSEVDKILKAVVNDLTVYLGSENLEARVANQVSGQTQVDISSPID